VSYNLIKGYALKFQIEPAVCGLAFQQTARVQRAGVPLGEWMGASSPMDSLPIKTQKCAEKKDSSVLRVHAASGYSVPSSKKTE